ncbi:ABC-2 transporter permease [Paraclostridium bifermentans]|jgi:ABC-2 type transport system permease protein|uniref:ABC-2 transporter permease n=1 Tax=Paraclostridium bifermentans TaxID=1490 RepID=UPI0018A0A3BD|nr:ABC-2 transporter permease [Paraclostridium bifermentans]
MNNLVNLLKLQFNSLFAIKKNLIFILVFGSIFAFTQPTMITFAGAMYLMLASYSVIFYEERSKMNYLIYSLPITIKEYIFSRYIYCLINTLIATLISSILLVIITVVGFNISNNISLYEVSLSTAIIGVFFTAVLMPATLLLGFEKGRYILVFIAVFPICFSAALVEIISKINVNLSTSALSILGILISIIVLLASFFITSNIFSKKEVQ